jgi:hypothetical protein
MAESEQRQQPLTPSTWERRLPGFSLGRGQRNCAACGHFLPVGWPADMQTCQRCQDAGRVPRPPQA